MLTKKDRLKNEIRISIFHDIYISWYWMIITLLSEDLLLIHWCEYSGPLNNMGWNCTGPLICPLIFFPLNMYYSIWGWLNLQMWNSVQGELTVKLHLNFLLCGWLVSPPPCPCSRVTCKTVWMFLVIIFTVKIIVFVQLLSLVSTLIINES